MMNKMYPVFLREEILRIVDINKSLSNGISTFLKHPISEALNFLVYYTKTS